MTTSSLGLKGALVSLCLFFFYFSYGQQNDLDYFNSLYQDQDSVELYVERAYTDILINPVPEATFDSLRTKVVGTSFTDPNFGREWTFLTKNGTNILNSERRAWNSDESIFALRTKNYVNYREYSLFDGSDGTFLRKVRFNTISQNESDLRWMPNDPDKMFFLDGNQIFTFDVNTETVDLFETFASFTFNTSKIAGGDGNQVDANGDFLIGNYVVTPQTSGPNKTEGIDCFVYNFTQQQVVRLVNGVRTYVDPGSPFTTYYLGEIDHATAFNGLIIKLEAKLTGDNKTKLADINGNEITEIYKRTPHFDPNFFLDNGILYPGFTVRYNTADATYYNNLGFPTANNGDSFFHGWNPSYPSQFVRFKMSSWPSTTLSSGGQHSSNRPAGTHGLICQHGPGEYNLTPWDKRYGECYEKAYYTADATMDRRFAHHYIGFTNGYSSSQQPEGWLSPNGDFAIIKTKWGWYKVALGPRMSKAEVESYLNLGNSFSLNTNSVGGGSIGVSPSGSTFASGTVVSLTATPDAGYQFDGWSGDLTGTTTPASITMDANKSITASFSLISSNTGDIYQAEDATLSNATTNSNHSGFNGTGFVDYVNQIGSYVEFTVNVTNTTDYDLIIRFANGSTNVRPMEILVNGAVQHTSVDLQLTGAWDNWAEDTVLIQLMSGSNIIRLTATASDGGPNLDQIELKESLPLYPSEYQAEDASLFDANVFSNHSGYTGTGFVDYINQVGSYVEWTVNVANTGSHDITLRYANGSVDNRPMSIEVNGNIEHASVDFQPTNAWDNWSDQSFTVPLTVGINTIRATALTVNGGPSSVRL